MHQPGAGIADAELSFQGQGRQAGFGLADQVDRQKPNGQRQVAALKDGSRKNRGLVVAGVALKGFRLLRAKTQCPS